jgi:hypothetical protein
MVEHPECCFVLPLPAPLQDGKPLLLVDSECGNGIQTGWTEIVGQKTKITIQEFGAVAEKGEELARFGRNRSRYGHFPTLAEGTRH